MNTSLQTMSIVKNMTIDAPAERVFAALTDPRVLPQFWGEGVERWESDLRPGGRWASYGRFPDGGRFCVKGVFRHVHPKSLVEMTVEHTQRDAADTVIRFEFAEAGGTTELRVTHFGFVDERFRDDHSAGWDDILARLMEFVSAR